YSDFSKLFILFTDTSDTALGAILFQKDENGQERKKCLVVV
ncbi:42713_t:CDS:2, partial [Gigaspora margarita]